MEANITTLNSTNDKIIVTYLHLPNSNTYSLTGGFNYSSDFDEFQHIIVYSRPYDIPCFTHSDVSTESVLPQQIAEYKSSLLPTTVYYPFCFTS